MAKELFLHYCSFVKIMGNLTYAVDMESMGRWRKRPLLTCSKSTGVGMEVLQIAENLSSDTSWFINILVLLRSRKKLSKTTGG